MNLTHNQKQVVAALASSKTIKEIALELGVSEKTTEDCIRRVKAKLGIRAPGWSGVALLTRYAVREGLITLDNEGNVIASYYYESSPRFKRVDLDAALRLPDSEPAAPAASTPAAPRLCDPARSACRTNRPRATKLGSTRRLSRRRF